MKTQKHQWREMRQEYLSRGETEIQVRCTVCYEASWYCIDEMGDRTTRHPDERTPPCPATKLGVLRERLHNSRYA